MAIFREEKSKEKPYTVISNETLGDESITNSARGLLCQLLSKPDNWVFNVKNLVENTKDGRDAIYSDLRELRANGYIVKRPIRNEKGVIVKWQEFVYESPQEEAKEIYKEQKERREKSALKRAEAIIKKNRIKKELANEKFIVKNEKVDYVFNSVDKKIVKKTIPNVEKPLITKANENMCTETVIGDNQHEIMDKSTYGKSVNGYTPSGSLVNIINNKLLSNDIVNTNTSSCSSYTDTNIVKELILNFTSSICELKRTTLPKFINLIKGLDIHFIEESVKPLCLWM